MFRRIRNPEGLLVPEAPIVFRRHLPSGRPETQLTGIRVEVRVQPNLRVFVLDVPALSAVLSGAYSFGDVVWDQHPSPNFPAASLTMLAADVRDVLRLFRLREINPRAWTSSPEALAHL